MPDDQGSVAEMSVVWPTRTPATSVIALCGTGPPTPDDDAEAHVHASGDASGPAGGRAAMFRSSAVSSAGDPTPRDKAALRLRRLPERLAAMRAIDVAESFRDLPGLVAPRERAAGSQCPLDVPDGRPRRRPGGPRRGRRPVRGRPPARWPGWTERSSSRRDAPQFTGGLVGFLGYDLGHALERLPSIAVDDQGLPLLRLALHDWVVAWDRRTGHAWLAGRALDGDARRLARRLDDVHARLDAGRVRAGRADDRVPKRRPISPAGRRSRSARSSSRAAYEAGVEAVREHIARGDIYQANLTRRLETPFDADPWQRYRRLRTGDPSLFSAYVDLGSSPLTGRPRALLSASPEPFLAVDADGHVTSDPIKGTGDEAGPRDEDRALARELLSSAKDRAENVMIVDVLRNDLGRVCRPGQRPRPTAVPARADGRGPAPRLDRDRPPEPRARRVRPARRGVPGRVDHRRAEDPGDGDPRGARAGPPRARTRARIGWIGAGRGDADAAS